MDLVLVLTPRKTAEQVFPKLVWEEIFNYLSSKDFVTCTLANLTFSNLLNKQKATIMFPEVFQLMHGYLKPGDVLKCRWVSNAWKEAVNDFLQKDPSHFPHPVQYCPRPIINQRIVPPPRTLFFGNYLKPDNIEDLERSATIKFLTNKGNPFSISRHISYQENRVRNENRVYTRATLMRILAKYGSAIWYCHIRLSFNREEATRIRETIRSYLALMPNLKSLALFSDIYQEYNYDICVEQSIRNRFEAEPFPTLRNLTDLSIGLGTMLDIQLLNAYNQILHLQLTPAGSYRSKDEYIWKVIDEGIKLPQLKSLCINSIPKGSKSLDFLLRFPSIEHVWLKLSKNSMICNTIYNSNDDCYMYTYESSIWELVPTLKSLKVTFGPNECFAVKQSGEGGFLSVYLAGKEVCYTREGYAEFCRNNPAEGRRILKN